MSTTKIFESQDIPDGYKLIYEEDTGECFFVLASDNSTTFLEHLEAVNNSTPNSSQLQIGHKSKENEMQVNLGVFADNTKQPSSQRPLFLTQTSVSAILSDLSETFNLNSSHSIITNKGATSLDETVNIMDESWFREFISADPLFNNIINNNNNNNNNYDAQQNEVTQQRLNEPQQQTIVVSPAILSAEHHQLIDMSRNQSLLALNLNQSILNDSDNQTYFQMQPPSNQRGGSANINETSQIVNNELNGKFEN